MGVNNALTEAVYYILLSLMEPMHGYGIMQSVEQRSGGRLRWTMAQTAARRNTSSPKQAVISSAPSTPG